MSDHDDLTAQFREMKSMMKPSPELVSRVHAAIEAKDNTAVHTVAVRTEPKIVAKPINPARSPRPRLKAKGRIGILSGGLVAAAMAVLMIVSMPGASYYSPWPDWPDPVTVSANPANNDTPRALVDPQDYEKIYQALASTNWGYNTSAKYGWATLWSSSTTETADVSGAAPGNAQAPAAIPDIPRGTGNLTNKDEDYTGTNVQVTGVDEGDIVKTDGSYIYIAKGRSVAVIAADGKKTRQAATIDASQMTVGDELLTGPIVGMMISDSRLILLLHAFTPELGDWTRDQGSWLSMEASSLKAVLYDISDPEHPEYLTMVTQSGTYVDSRLTDGVLYLISRYYVESETTDPSQPDTYIPTVNTGDGDEVICPEDIDIMPVVMEPTYQVVTALNVTSGKLLGEQAILGRANTVYMSTTSLFLASTQYMYRIVPTEQGGVTIRIPGADADFKGDTTDIVRIGLNSGDLKVEAQGTVPGVLINQFALDEYDGYLRVATTWADIETGLWDPTPSLWVLDSSMKLVGSIPELVKDESIYSVRFTGAIAYVVTFRRVDPLFAIDLSDPANPTVMSALKIPGFSTYMHPFGEGLLLGVGVDADNDGRTNGLKLSMFDVSDPYDVKEIATVHIDADDTEVSQDHKAAFVDVSRSLIGIPTTTWQGKMGNERWGNNITWDYRFYSWDGSAFVSQADVNLFNGDYSEMGPSHSDPYTRGIRISDSFYLVISSQVRVYDLSDYSQIANITLK
ncbi:MAG: beta-propeller domain-containing protein [Propionibacteriaceae bacterium]|nr:beta-propeller domain-containing protein [Propionibacteriaceae bacterium]